MTYRKFCVKMTALMEDFQGATNGTQDDDIYGEVLELAKQFIDNHTVKDGLSIQFATDGAAFDGSNVETVRLLVEIKDLITLGSTGRKIVDHNGNVVGEWELN